MYSTLLLLSAALNGPQTAGGESELVIESALVTLIEQVEVPAREVGVLSAVSVREGELVEQDQPLAEIEDAEVKLLETRARLDVEIAREQAENDIRVRFSRKSWEVARAELRRATESVEKYRKSISETELDRLRLAVERAALEIEQSERELALSRLTVQSKENELALARRGLERRRLLAPLAGMVVQINRRQGEWVEPGDVVLRILRVNRLRAEGFLDASQATGDLTGRPVTLTLDRHAGSVHHAGDGPAPGRPQFTGTLVFVSPEIDPVNGQVRVWAEIDNPDLRLRPGTTGALSIHPHPAAASQE